MNEQDTKPKFEWKGEVSWRTLNRSLIALSGYLIVANNHDQLVNPQMSTIVLGAIGIGLIIHEYIKDREFGITKIKRGKRAMCNDCEIPCPLQEIVQSREKGILNISESLNILHETGKHENKFNLTDGFTREFTVYDENNFDCELKYQ